ncbi:MAG: lysophospholipid acyltransferase family protein, partial [Pseudomonadota bacterium]
GRARARRFSRVLLNGFGVHVERVGTAPTAGTTLYVANHVSWTDIFAMIASVNANFVAKTEVGTWPLVGPISKRLGTLFVARGNRSGVAAQAAAIRDRLSAGGNLVLFPEGTTSTGRDVQPFRTSLMSAAAAAAQVQPVSIVYTDRQGRPLNDAMMDRVSWVGDASFLPSARLIAPMAVRAEITLLDPIAGDILTDRKALTAAAHDAIRMHYTTRRSAISSETSSEVASAGAANRAA